MHARSRVVRRNAPVIHATDASKDTMVVGRGFVKRRQSAAPSILHQKRKERAAPKSRTNTDEEAGQLESSATTAGHQETNSRGTYDFPSIVLEASRQASYLPVTASHYDSSPGTDPGRFFTSPQRRRVVNVSDHKTCALLMARMKEANRQLPSPSG